MKTILSAILMVAVTAGCSTSPFHDAPAVSGATGPTVLWGGRILSVDTAGGQPSLEVAAYVLGAGDRPLPTAPVRGVTFRVDPVDPANQDYAPGRFMTALGTVSGDGEELRIVARQVEVWPSAAYGDAEGPVRLRQGVDRYSSVTPSTFSAGYSVSSATR